MWVPLILFIVSSLISYALRPKPQQPVAATLSDFSEPQIEIGKPIAVVFGEAWIDDANVLWYGDLSNSPIKSEGRSK